MPKLGKTFELVMLLIVLRLNLPDNLPEADKTAMNFGSGGNTDAKAWKDIWGCGQGIGNIESVETIGDVVDSLEAEYKEAVAELHNKERLLG